MSDIYLQITETPTVVTLSAPVVSGALASTVTVANTVTVALDSNSLSALENVTVTVGAAITGTVTVSNFPASQAVTFSAVSISNFPATQTIAGTVTANVGTILAKRTDGGAITVGYLPLGDSSWSGQSGAVLVMGGADDGAVPAHLTSIAGVALDAGIGSLPISGTVTVGNSVTIGSLPALAAGTAQIGSVTASISGTVPVSGTFWQTTQPASLASLPALAAGTAQIGSVTASISNSVTIGSLPAISGTVTANTFALQGTAVTTSNFTSTTASTVLANYNATREVLTIFNEGAGLLFVCPGALCTTTAYQVRLSAGDYYEVPNHQTTITHSAVFATAGTARVTEVS